MKIKTIWRTLIIFLLFRIATLAWGLIGLRLVPLREGFLGGGSDLYQTAPLFWGWANFDGVHYLSIAEHGYFQFQQAFFPLFPLVLRIGARFTPLNFVWSGLVAAQLFCLLSLLVLVDLVEQPVDRFRALILWLSFPTAFFLVSVYTESLFVFLTLGCFWLAKKRRWLLAGLAAGLAGATRVVGIFLLPALLWELWRSKSQNRRRSLIGTLILAPLGLLIYLVYLHQTTGDPFYFFHTQPQFGAERSGSAVILLPQVIWRYLKILVTVSPGVVSFWVALVELILTGFTFGFLYLVRSQLPFSWMIFCLGVVLTPTLTGTLSSMPRYVLPAIVLMVTRRLSRLQRRAWVILFLPLQAVLAALFLRGYFVS